MSVLCRQAGSPIFLRLLLRSKSLHWTVGAADLAVHTGRIQRHSAQILPLSPLCLWHSPYSRCALSTHLRTAVTTYLRPQHGRIAAAGSDPAAWNGARQTACSALICFKGLLSYNREWMVVLAQSFSWQATVITLIYIQHTGALASLQRLGLTCDLVVVTSRQHVIRQPTLEWIQLHFPYIFSEVHFGNHWALHGTARKKSDICRWGSHFHGRLFPITDL